MKEWPFSLTRARLTEWRENETNENETVVKVISLACTWWVLSCSLAIHGLPSMTTSSITMTGRWWVFGQVIKSVCWLHFHKPIGYRVSIICNANNSPLVTDCQNKNGIVWPVSAAGHTYTDGIDWNKNGRLVKKKEYPKNVTPISNACIDTEFACSVMKLTNRKLASHVEDRSDLMFGRVSHGDPDFFWSNQTS